jgi:hypothetical protein
MRTASEFQLQLSSVRSAPFTCNSSTPTTLLQQHGVPEVPKALPALLVLLTTAISTEQPATPGLPGRACWSHWLQQPDITPEGNTLQLVYM